MLIFILSRVEGSLTALSFMGMSCFLPSSNLAHSFLWAGYIKYNDDDDDDVYLCTEYFVSSLVAIF